MTGGPQRVVTFDLFSALLDSRTGGSAVFDRLALAAGWPVTGAALYDAWDAHNKTAQRDCVPWMPWLEPASRALARTYASFGLDGDVTADVEALVDSMSGWPLWPDAADGLPGLAAVHRVGVLSNVDDELFARTAAAVFVEPDLVLTSQRLQAYKPHAAIYRRAVETLGSMVHVATSARDVRGALEAGTRWFGCDGRATSSTRTDPTRRTRWTASPTSPRSSGTSPSLCLRGGGRGSAPGAG